jgi:hypothetical protein
VSRLRRPARTGDGMRARDASVTADRDDRDCADPHWADPDWADPDWADPDWAAIVSALRRLGAAHAVPGGLHANVMRRVRAEQAWVAPGSTERSARAGIRAETTARSARNRR